MRSGVLSNQESNGVAFKLQSEMDQAGVKRAQVLFEAGVSRATFWRWLQGISAPRKASVTAIRDAIQRVSSRVAEE